MSPSDRADRPWPAAAAIFLASITLKAGTKPKEATIKFVGKKALLQSPTLPLMTPITVRVQRSDGASCYEAVFSTPKKNVIGKLTGKSD